MLYLVFTILAISHLGLCSWISEWMSPIQEQLKQNPSQGNHALQDLFANNGNPKIHQEPKPTESTSSQMMKAYSKYSLPTTSLKMKLESALQNAKTLTEALQKQINDVTERENSLKDAVVNGRSGATIVTVTSINRAPRSYIIRDGVWTLCNGVIQSIRPKRTNQYDELLSVPRCIGMEELTPQDPCVFNSVTTYETVPTTRRLEYSEDEFLCLKQSFNTTLERYLSVPRGIIDKTCRNGLIRSLEDNIATCGVRVLAEYTYYPRENEPSLPLEYCIEADGSCKLTVAWHVSNSTIENFEFINEQSFRKFFIMN